jgi:hypothetical protein
VPARSSTNSCWRSINVSSCPTSRPSIHVYPTYAVGVQQLAAQVRPEAAAASPVVRLARGLATLAGARGGHVD